MVFQKSSFQELIVLFHSIKVCSASCATCSGPGTNNCTSCNNSLYLDGSSCVSSCTPGKFANITAHACQRKLIFDWLMLTHNFVNEACYSSCEVCSGSKNGQCSSCVSGTFLLTNATGGYCISNCSSLGYYPNTTDFTCYGILKIFFSRTYCSLSLNKSVLCVLRYMQWSWHQ